jgi:quercetin dioxygenase-like cupin family protein
MSKKSEKFLYNIDDLSSGIFRELTKGITTRVFPGDEAMISVVRVEPNAEGTVHSHPQEQWGLLIRGSATRLQGENTFEVREGDFWRTPGNVRHSVIGGPDGAVILDVFAPPREEYLETGTGFGESN